MVKSAVVGGSESVADPEFLELVERLEQRLLSGQAVNIDELTRDHPEYAPRLGQLLPAMQASVELGVARAMTSVTSSVTAGSVKDPLCLGEFRLIREIGRGGMGIVYEAEQLTLGRQVALKVMPFAAILNPRQLERFKNEARAAATLHHPNIVPIYSVGCDRGVHYYAMQYIEGGSLAKVLEELAKAKATASNIQSRGVDETARATPTVVDGAKVRSESDAEQPSADVLSAEYTHDRTKFVRHVAQFGIDAAEALENAHFHGVIHRDIKPANLLLDIAGHLWITDFGLARLERDAGMTMSGDVLGTLRYMSPEQAQGEWRIVDPRTDVYSLGATLYELLTLEPVFAATDHAILLKQITGEEPRSLRSLDHKIPEELETIVLKALEKSPEHRYSSAQSLADDLQRFLERRPISARPPTKWGRIVRWCRRHAETVTAAASMLILASLMSLSLAGWALRERARAQASLLGALRNQQWAQQERNRAVDAHAAAQQQEELARQQRDTAEYNLYVTNSQMAKQAMDTGRSGLLFDTLAAMTPRPGHRDLRGWEWYYLVSECNRQQLTIALQGCGDASNPLAWSPDGRRLATVDFLLRCINIWDADTGQLQASLNDCPHVQEICLAWSPDGRYLAAGGDRRTIAVWDLTSGMLLRSLYGHAATVRCLDWSESSGRLASGADDGTILIWDPQQAVLLSSQSAPRPVRSLDWHTDGQRLLSVVGAAYPTDVIWDVSQAGTWSEIAVTSTEEGAVRYASFQPNGSLVAEVVDRAGTLFLRIADWKTHERVAEFRKPCETLPAWSPDGRYLATAHRRALIDVWDVAAQEVIASIPVEAAVRSVAWCPSNVSLAASLSNGTVKIWSTPSSPTDGVLRRFDRYALSVAFAPDCQRLLVGGRFGLLRVIDVTTGKDILAQQKGLAWLDAIAWSPDGRRFAAKSDEGITVYDAVTGDPVPPLLRCDGVCSLAWSPNGKFLTAGSVITRFGSELPRIWLFDAVTGREVAKSADDVDAGARFAWRSDGQCLASAGTPIRIWDSSLRQVLAVANSRAERVAWSPDGTCLAAGQANGEIAIYDTSTWNSLAVLRGHSDEVTTIAWHPDSLRLATGCLDGAIKLWDTFTGRELMSLQVHSDRINQIAWSQDGLRLASASHDGTVRIWDRSGGDHYIKSHSESLREVYERIAAGEYDASIDLLQQLCAAQTTEPLLARQIERVKWRQALAQVQEGRKDTSAKALAEISSKNLGFPDSHLALSRAVFAKSPDAGLAMMEELVHEFPKKQSYRDELAFLYESRASQLCESGRFDEAVVHLRRLAKEFPDGPDFRAELTYRMAKAGHLDEVIAALDAMADLFRGWPDYRPELARHLISSEEYDIAATVYERLVREFPAEREYRTRLGSCLRDADRTEEAIVVLQSLVDEFSDVPQYRFELGLALQQRGNELALKYGDRGLAIATYGDAIVLFEELVARFPEDSHYSEWLIESLLFRAKAFRDQGELGRAVPDYTRICALAPQLPGTCNVVAWRLATFPGYENRDLRGALDLATRAVALQPASAEYRSTLGMLHYRAGDWEAAIRELTNSHESANTQEGCSWCFEAMAHWQLGQRDEARRCYARAVQWMEQYQSNDATLIGFCAEAAALLGIEQADPPDS